MLALRGGVSRMLMIKRWGRGVVQHWRGGRLRLGELDERGDQTFKIENFPSHHKTVYSEQYWQIAYIETSMA